MSGAVLEPDLTQPCSLGRQRSRNPPPKRLGSKHDVTHMALTLSHDLEQPQRHLSCSAPIWSRLRWWAVLCEYDLVGVNEDPGRMALKHMHRLSVNNIL